MCQTPSYFPNVIVCSVVVKKGTLLMADVLMFVTCLQHRVQVDNMLTETESNQLKEVA